MEEDITTWESEGGSVSEPPVAAAGDQVWASRITAKVNARFDRLISALQALALKQPHQGRLGIFAIMLVLEERRAKMLLNERDDCFIHDWQQRGMKRGQVLRVPRLR